MQNSTPTNRTLSSIVGASLTLLDQVNTEGLVDSISVELSCTSGSALVDFQVLLQMTPDGDFFPLFVAADWRLVPWAPCWRGRQPKAPPHLRRERRRRSFSAISRAYGR